MYHRGCYDAFELVAGIEEHKVCTKLDVVVMCLLIRDHGVGNSIRYVIRCCIANSAGSVSSEGGDGRTNCEGLHGD